MKKIALIFDKNISYTTGQYVFDCLQEKNLEVKIFSRKNLGEIFSFSPNLVLAVDDGSHYIADINVYPKAIWLIDTHTSFSCDKTMAKSFDVVFVAQKEDVEKFESLGKKVFWLPLACDPKNHGKISTFKKYDIGFIGGWGIGKRNMIMKKLKENFPNSYIGPAPHDKIGEIYSQSKIVVNSGIKNDINMRVFEGLCSGSLLVTNKIEDNGFTELFDDGKDLVVYDGSFSNLKDKIEHYLKHEEEREKIAGIGMEKVLSLHTYKNRVDFIIEKVEKFILAKKETPKTNYVALKTILFFKVIFWRIKNQLWKISEKLRKYR